MLDEVAAFAEYEAGNLDVATVPLADMDRVKADPTLSKELQIAPESVHLLLRLQHQGAVRG